MQQLNQYADNPDTNITRIPINNPQLRQDTYEGPNQCEEYLSHFEDCAELNEWNNKQKVLFLASSLRGPARNYYMSLSREEKRLYYTLTNKLGLRFGVSKHQNKWLTKLEQRKREPGESIAAVGDDIRQIAQKAYVGLDQYAQEFLAHNPLRIESLLC